MYTRTDRALRADPYCWICRKCGKVVPPLVPFYVVRPIERPVFRHGFAEVQHIDCDAPVVKNYIYWRERWLG